MHLNTSLYFYISFDTFNCFVNFKIVRCLLIYIGINLGMLNWLYFFGDNWLYFFGKQ